MEHDKNIRQHQQIDGARWGRMLQVAYNLMSWEQSNYGQTFPIRIFNTISLLFNDAKTRKIGMMR